MSMKMVCNRCNKVKEDGESFDHVNCCRHLAIAEYDLCPECSKQFSIFMDGGTVEEDHYKDSKPSAVVIHKLASGHYGIESVPKDDKEPKHSRASCANCAYTYNYNGMLCCGAGNSGGDFVSGDMICSKWESKEDEREEHAKFDDWLIDKRDEEAVDAMNKEESDLSVDIHTNAAGITVPDSEPWVTSKKHISLPNACCTCTYEFRAPDVEPCKSCKTYSNWKSRETTNEQSSET